MGRVLWDRIATVLVSLAFALDWLPAYVTGLPSGMVSLTRWVAVPLMLVSMVVEPNAYLPVMARPQAIVLALAAVVGMGGGVAAGTIPASVLVSFMPSLLAVVFYARRRDVRSVAAALTSLLVGSWVVCVVVVLAGLNVVSGRTVVASQVTGGVYERTWAGLSSSLLGPWLSVLVGSLGGLALHPQNSWATVLAAASIGVSTLVAVVTAQRSIVVVVALSLLLGTILAIANMRRKGTRFHGQRHSRRNIALAVCFLLILLVLLWPTLREHSFTLRYRFAAMQTMTGGAVRLNMWRQFVIDVISRPRIIAPGESDFVTAMGNVPHLMLGESYYYGGLLMLVAMLALVVSSIRSAFRAVHRSVSVEWASMAGIIVSALLPTLAYLTIMPGFISRLPYVLMGMALSLPGRSRLSLGYARHGGHTAQKAGVWQAIPRVSMTMEDECSRE